MADEPMSLIEELQNPPRLQDGRLDEDRVIDLMRIAAIDLSIMIGVASKACEVSMSQQRKTCPTCFRTDKEYRDDREWRHGGMCGNPWHDDDHLRRSPEVTNGETSHG